MQEQANRALPDKSEALNALKKTREFRLQEAFNNAIEEKPLPPLFADFSAKSGEALQKALAIHPVWGKFPEQDRPRVTQDMTNRLLLRQAQSTSLRVPLGEEALEGGSTESLVGRSPNELGGFA